MRPDQNDDFPTGSDFLKQQQALIDEFSATADSFASQSGRALPATLQNLGTVLSFQYRLACCAWGCKGGDHQVEWLAGRIVNQALSAHRLIRAGFYDEALMLVRGIGEMANLLWLFGKDSAALSDWRKASTGERQRKYSPFAVRLRLEELVEIGPPIDRARYAKLCEVGTHPMPHFAPGHYSGTGRPVLGCLLQPAGVYVSVTELGYAVAMCSYPLIKLLEPEEEVCKRLHWAVARLVRELGAFTVLNYEALLKDARNPTSH